MAKSEKKNTRKLNHKLIIRIELLILAIIAVAGIYQLAKHNPGVKEAIAMATTIKPETFTEIYFEDSPDLSTTFVPGHSNEIKFTIHNLEYKPVEYKYRIVADTATSSSLLASNFVWLDQDEYQTIDELFTLHEATRTAVLISLENMDPQIHLWLEPEISEPKIVEVEILPTTTGWLRVRSNPDALIDNQISLVETGKRFPFIESTNKGWTQIEYEPGSYGWIVSRYTQLTDQDNL